MKFNNEEIAKREDLFNQGLKICSHCKMILPLEKFNKNKKQKDGFSRICKNCNSIYGKKHYEQNKDDIKAKSKKYKEENCQYYKEYLKQYRCIHPNLNKDYYNEHKERIQQLKKDKWPEYYEKNKDRLLQYQKQYRADNADLCKERSKKYRELHREEILKKHKEYRDTHREERKRWLNSESGRASERASRHKRRALILKNGGSFTKDEIISALQFFDYMCPYTGEPLEDSYHLDHIVALSKGGTNYIWNIVPCNSVANLSKGNKDMVEWYRKQPYFSEERLYKIYEWINLQKKLKENEQDESRDTEEVAS